MPVPQPNEKESKTEYISRVIRWLTEENAKKPENKRWSREQIIAIAYSSWEKAKNEDDDVMDPVLILEEFVQMTQSRTKCMRCEEFPTKDVLYAEGMGRVWFCDLHFEQWCDERGGPWADAKEGEEHYDPEYLNRDDIIKVFMVSGKVPEKWKEHYMNSDKRWEVYNESIQNESFGDASYPDSCFMWVPEEAKGKDGKKSVRKLPYKNKDGSINMNHVLAAIKLLPKTKGIPAEAKARILHRLQSIYKKANPDYKPSV